MIVACSGPENRLDGDPGTGGTGGENPADASPDNTSDDGIGDNNSEWDINSPDEDIPTCNPKGDPDEDQDGDGYTPNQGDCNDCNASINPGAFDVPGNGIDDDCDGIKDNEVEVCDSDLAIDDDNPENGARAMDLCRFTDENAVGKNKTWGVIKGSAKYVKVDGTPGMNPIGHGLLPSFGVEKLWKGHRMLVLSTGAARAPGQPDYEPPNGVDHGTSGEPPEGYPKESEFCPDVVTGDCFDPAALELKIRVPTNAKSFSFNLDFYTYEYPDWICSQFNDFYVTLMWPKAPSLPDHNISFDSAGNSISVNNGLLQVCEPGTHKEKTFECPLGTDALKDTGFIDSADATHAATGWLVTEAPVEPGSIITLRFAVWDSGDFRLDSTVLIDNFKWDTETVEDIATIPAPPR